MSKQFRESRGHRWESKVVQVDATVTMTPNEIRNQLRRLDRLQLSLLFTRGPVVPPIHLVEANGGIWALPQRGPGHDAALLHRLKLGTWPDVEHLRIDVEPLWSGLGDVGFDNAATVTLSAAQVRRHQTSGWGLEDSLNVVARSFMDRFKVLPDDAAVD